MWCCCSGCLCGGCFGSVAERSASRTGRELCQCFFYVKCSCCPSSRAPSCVFPPLFFSGVRTVYTINMCFCLSSANIVFIQSLLRHCFTVCVVIFPAFKDGTVGFLFWTCFQAPLALPCSCASLLVTYFFPLDSPFLIFES